MPHAYVATPDVVVEDPWLPPGWNPIWPYYPGAPEPPGYPPLEGGGINCNPNPPDPCVVDLTAHHPVSTIAPSLNGLCVGYTTDGMQVFAERTNSGAGGWSNFIGDAVTGVCNTPRFWFWTQYPQQGVWHGTTVGLISKGGRILDPIGGNHVGIGWNSEPVTGNDTENWWLVQVVQEPLVEGDDPAVTRPLTGTIHWSAYTITSIITCSTVFFEAEGGYRLWISGTTSGDTCSGSTTTSQSQFGFPFFGPCHVLWDASETYWPSAPDGVGFRESSTSYEAEDDPISEGADSFLPWAVYIALLYPEDVPLPPCE